MGTHLGADVRHLYLELLTVPPPLSRLLRGGEVVVCRPASFDESDRLGDALLVRPTFANRFYEGRLLLFRPLGTVCLLDGLYHHHY